MPASASTGETKICRRILDAIEDPVFLLDAELRIVACNRGAVESTAAAADPRRGDGEARVAGPSPESPRRFGDLGAGEPWRSARSAAQSARHWGRPARRDVVDSSTGCHWRIRAEAVGDEAGSTLVVLRDTTDLLLLHEGMRRRERLDVLAKAVAGLAHEIRNPLFGLSSGIEFLKLALGDDAGSPEVHQTFELLEGELERLSSRLEQFVGLGSAPVERSVCSLRSLVEWGWEAAGRRCGRRDVRLSLRVSEGMRCLADRGRVTEAISRVLENAIAFSPRGEVVEVTAAAGDWTQEASGSSGPLRRLGSRSSRAGGYALLRIRDHGPGFRHGEELEVFEPFYTGSEKGVGLGLALAERVIQEHGGEVGAANAEDGGAVVYLCLPVAAAEGGAAASSGGSDIRVERPLRKAEEG